MIRVKYIIQEEEKSKVLAGEGDTSGLFPLYTSGQGLSKYLDRAQFAGDAIIMGTGGIASVNYSRDPFSTSTDCFTFRGNGYHTRFLYFYLTAFVEFINATMFYGTGLKHLNKQSLKNMKAPDLDIHKQLTITSFLDNKTKKIDQLISNIEQSIDKLERYKTSYAFQLLEDFFIYRDEPARIIGLENQSTLRLDQVCKIVRGNSTFKKDELKDKGKYIALQYGKTYKVDIVDQEFNYYVDEEFYKESQIVNKGDTILISTSETMEDLGHSCYYDINDFGLIGGEQILLKPNTSKVESKFLYYGSIIFTKSLRKEATGLKVYRFNTDDLKNIFLNLPSLAAQKEIISSLDVLFLNLKVLIKLKKEKIEKLIEYKKSLIYEAVTGKIEVM